MRLYEITISLRALTLVVFNEPGDDGGPESVRDGVARSAVMIGPFDWADCELQLTTVRAERTQNGPLTRRETVFRPADPGAEFVLVTAKITIAEHRRL